jgi:crossover junction endodeoxyribonuclease RusA
VSRSWTIELVGPRYSANDRLHWRAAQPLKTAWRDLAQVHTRAVVGVSFDPPQQVHILVEQVPGSRRKTDPGNVAPAAKAAIDGMVRAGLLIDDDAVHLLGPDYRLAAPQSVQHGQWRLRLTVAEVDVGCPVHPGGDCPALPEMCGDRACTCCLRPAVRQEWVSTGEDA